MKNKALVKAKPEKGFVEIRMLPVPEIAKNHRTKC